MYRSLALSHLHGRSLMEDGAVSDDGNSESSDTNASKLSERDQAALSVFILITILGLMIYALRRLMRMIEAGLQKVRWRANVNNSFRSSNGYGTDWVIVVPVLLDSVAATAYQMKYSLMALLEATMKAGFKTRCFYSNSCTHVFIKISAPPSALCTVADKMNYPMQLHRKRLSCRLSKGMHIAGWEKSLREAKGDEKVALRALKRASKWVWLPLDVDSIDPKRSFCKYGYTDFIYGKYDIAPNLQDLYKERTSRIFRGVDRIRLIRGQLQGNIKDGGAGLSFRELIHKKAAMAIFPVHDHAELLDLKRQWLVLWDWPMKQPFNSIRDYFGEKIAMYFLWLGMYTRWLFIASTIGIIAYLVDTGEGVNSDSYADIAFAFFMCTWSTCFIEAFKRTEILKAFEWGMIDFEDQEEVRPEFDPAHNPEIEVIPDVWERAKGTYFVAEGKGEFYYPTSKRRCRMYFSAVVIFFMTMIVIMLVLLVDYFKEQSAQEPLSKFVSYGGFNFGSTLGSILNALCIAVMSDAFDNVAPRLTEYENHRTDTKHESSLIAKLFAFNFVNSYAALFYIAFVQHLVLGVSCSDDKSISCIAVLGSTLQTLFLTKLVIGNIQEVVIPAYTTMKKLKALELEIRPKDILRPGEHEKGMADLERQAMRDARDPITVYEEQFIMMDYNIQTALKDDYLEMAIQYGYITLFSVALPLAPLLGFVNNYIEIRIDAWKITSNCRRPYPQGAEGIGVWHGILGFMNLAAILTNGVLMSFTSTALESFSVPWRLTIFVFFEHALIMIKMIVRLAVDDIPEDVQIQIKRQKHIVSKVIDNTEDDLLARIVAEGKVQSKRKKRLKPAKKKIYITDYEYSNDFRRDQEIGRQKPQSINPNSQSERVSMRAQRRRSQYDALPQDDTVDIFAQGELRQRQNQKHHADNISTPTTSRLLSESFLSAAATPLLEDMMPFSARNIKPLKEDAAPLLRGHKSEGLKGTQRVGHNEYSFDLETKDDEQNEALALEHIVMHSDFIDSHDDDDEALALERLVAKDDFSDNNSELHDNNHGNNGDEEAFDLERIIKHRDEPRHSKEA